MVDLKPKSKKLSKRNGTELEPVYGPIGGIGDGFELQPTHEPLSEPKTELVIKKWTDLKWNQYLS